MDTIPDQDYRQLDMEPHGDNQPPETDLNHDVQQWPASAVPQNTTGRINDIEVIDHLALSPEPEGEADLSRIGSRDHSFRPTKEQGPHDTPEGDGAPDASDQPTRPAESSEQIIAISDGDDYDFDGQQEISMRVSAAPNTMKREPSIISIDETGSADEGVAETIENHSSASPPLSQPLKLEDDENEVQVVKSDAADNNSRWPTLPPSQFIAHGLDQERVPIQPDASREQNDLADMLFEFHKNSDDIPEAPRADSEIDINNDDDSEEEDARAAAEFAIIKANHDAKAGYLDLSEQIEFNKAAVAEEARVRARQKKRDYQEAEFQEDHSMFFPDTELPSKSTTPARADDSDDPDSDLELLTSTKANPNTKRKRTTADVDSASDVPSEEAESTHQRPATKARKPLTKPPARKGTTATTKSSSRGKGSRGGRGGRGGRGSTRAGRGRGGRRGRQEDNLFDMASLLPYDLVGQTALNRQQEAQPELGTSNRRENVLADLIASLPDDQRDLHVGDKKTLEKAVKTFNGSRTMKAHEGKWRLKGMESSLHHHQTIGVGKMRERENEGKPFGGLLSDDMGFGKTIMAIANIIDGRPVADSPTRATLIICPAALQRQWFNEVTKHTDGKVGFIKNTYIWKSSAMQPSDPAAMLNGFDVVITSYHELLKSYPKKEPPPEITSPKGREEWWENHFQTYKGVLHTVKWHRIVLDEAQAIKNHLSRTSEAAWRLRGKYRWTLSGTPVVNSLEEFFAYFRFLKLWITGSFETWKQNFCKKGSAKALLRLREMLGKMMIRRTHQDKLFGRPIIQLPPIKPIKTVYLDFSPVERALYKIVRDRFVQRIRSIGSGVGNNNNHLNASYGSIFLLLLRLRQLTAHILLCQKTIKDLLLLEDLEKLWTLTESAESKLDGQSHAHTTAIAAALKNVASGDASQRSASRSVDPATTPVDVADLGSTNRKGVNDLSTRFRECLDSMRESGHWDKVNARSLCGNCSQVPVKPYVTSCLHIYCFTCLNELAYAGLLEEQRAATCLECNIKFKLCEAYAAQSFPSSTASTDNTARTQGRNSNSNGGSSDPEEDVDWCTLTGPILQSTKTAAAVAQIEAWFDQDPTNKILLFSQWRGILKVFGRICTQRRWGHASFHGEMSFEARNKAIETFSGDEDCRILLAAMKAGGVGLNLTAANRVILIDLWWNVAMETQAYCRVFRLGQTRDVEVVRFAVNNTVDMKILAMQDRKTAEIDSAMERKGHGGKLSTEELLRLFGVDDRGREVGDEEFVLPNDAYDQPDSDVEERGVEGVA